MSAGPHSLVAPHPAPDVLGELLHSLSQPLTSLRCSLELSIDEVAERRKESVAVALEHTEKVIGMVQLMREYLEAEQPLPGTHLIPLAPVLRSVVEELASIAAVSGISLCLVGTSSATMPIPESRLRVALQYMVAAMIETQPTHGKVMLLLGEGPAGAVLRAGGGRDLQSLERTATSSRTLRQVRIMIARRVFETAGASLVVSEEDGNGFVLRIPRVISRPSGT